MRFDEMSPPGGNFYSELSLSQEMSLFLTHRREISPTTPVLDTIDGLSAFAQQLFEEVGRGNNLDLFVIGRAGDGKSAISEQIIQKSAQLPSPIRRRYYNTSMAVEEAREKGLVTSAFGKFTPAEYHRISEQVIKVKLQTTEHVSDTQAQLRVLEFPAVEQKVNLGTSALFYSRERAQCDIPYRRRLVGVIGERALHRRSRRMRQEIWQAETRGELQHLFKKYNIVPDSPDIDPLDMRMRMGPPHSMDRIDADVEEQLLTLQGDIRLSEIDKSLPILTKKNLVEDKELEERALSDFLRLKAYDAGFLRDEVFIAVNRLLRRKIPYYGKMRNDPELQL